MADIKDKLPTPPGEKSSSGGVSHGVMSKSFGLQKKTLARVIGLEKRVDNIESNVGGISVEKFTELNKGIISVNNTLQAIGNALAAELVADKELAADEKTRDQREVDALKKGKAEKFLELETEKTAVKPVEKVKEKAKSVFQRLFDAISAVFGGWLIDKGAKMLKAWQEGDTETFNKMKNEIIKSLAVVGGLLLAVNLVGIIGSLKLLVAGLKIGIPAILGLLANPWTWVVLGIGVAGYFGFKAADKAITGGGEFKTFDKNLRTGTESNDGKAGGVDVKNMNTGALFLDASGKPIRVNFYDLSGLDGMESQDLGRGSLYGELPPVGDSARQFASASAEINILHPAHRKWIVDNYGESALAQADQKYQNYMNAMAIKDNIKKQMGTEIKEARKQWKADAMATKPEDGRVDWATHNKKWKEIESGIRVKYDKIIKLEFPELFDEDITTMPILKPHQTKYLFEESDDGGMKMYENPKFEGYIDTHKNQWWDWADQFDERKKDLPPSLRGDTSISSNNIDFNQGIDFKTSVELGSKLNNEKISSISSDLSDSASSFEFVPFDTAVNTDNNFNESMFTGDATELPSFSTFNNANDYRFYFTHTYQQGDE